MPLLFQEDDGDVRKTTTPVATSAPPAMKPMSETVAKVVAVS
jgi:hypothetical protein